MKLFIVFLLVFIIKNISGCSNKSTKPKDDSKPKPVKYITHYPLRFNYLYGTTYAGYLELKNIPLEATWWSLVKEFDEKLCYQDEEVIDKQVCQVKQNGVYKSGILENTFHKDNIYLEIKMTTPDLKIKLEIGNSHKIDVKCIFVGKKAQENDDIILKPIKDIEVKLIIDYNNTLASLPASPTEVRASLVNRTALVTWNYLGAEIPKHYLIYYAPKNDIMLSYKIADVTRKVYSITNLEPDTEYEIYVSAVNYNGEGNSSQPVFIITNPEESTSDTTITLIISAAVILIVIALTYIVAKKYYCKIKTNSTMPNEINAEITYSTNNIPDVIYADIQFNNIKENEPNESPYAHIVGTIDNNNKIKPL